MIKKILISFVLTTALFAQNFNGVKIYINPGHGGHDSDDRHIVETGFWESEGNLTKGLRLRDYLVHMGANVRMSRTTNYSSDDLPLSVIDADANNFDADYFHSIHSNAYNRTTNYTLLLYKETNGQPVFAKAKQMADKMSPRIYQVDRTTKYYVRGDYSFLGFHLGVLRTLNMPGTLSEGSFHDYIPESWRLMNLDYRRHEALGITRAFLSYYNLGSRTVGALAGILRDPNEKVKYYYIPGTKDDKRPVNNFTVTLLPVGKVYQGDALNNGFYFFDSLQPGNYTLVFNAEDYEPDTVEATVTAGTTTFYDRYLTPKPNYNHPQVISFLPDTNTAADLDIEIEIDFDIRMNTSSVISALGVNPTINGSVEWSNNDKTLKLIPSAKLQAGVTYTISIDTTAKSFYGVSLAKKFVATFTTRSDLNFLGSYPSDGEEDVSQTVVIYLKFDGQIDPNSLTGRVRFVDSNDKDINIFVDPSGYSNGKIIFEPMKPLARSAEYRILLSAGIKDRQGLVFNENKTITFFTTKEKYVSGNILDDLETPGQWWDPDASGSTRGTDATQTTFKISTERKVSGNSSGKITYVFTGDDGVCREFDPATPSVGSDGNDTFGMWIFGDLSGNVLQYWFYDSQRNNGIVTVDTLDWTGWKLKKIKISEIPLSGEKYFHSIVIRQTPSGTKSSAIYFDDVQTGIVTGVKNNSELPVGFSLAQNYPNPFGSKSINGGVTRISFSLPNFAFVKLEVFNILGQKVKTIINNEAVPKGTATAMWNGTNDSGIKVPSGVYVYRLTAKAGNKVYSAVKKLIVIK